MQRGIKQGDPLSPFLFNLVLDPLLYELNESGRGFHINHTNVAALAYADDIVRVASSLAELQRNLDVAIQYLSMLGLTLNPSKTQYFGWSFDAHNLKWFDYGIPELRLEGVMDKPKARNEPIKYLGLELYVNKPAWVSNKVISNQVGSS